jgi:hypothetical protein
MLHPRILVLLLIAVIVGATDLAAAGDARSIVCSWRGLALPTLESGVALNAVDVVGPSDVWIVGTSSLGYPTPSQPVMLHWDGTRFRRDRLRVPNADLRSVSATGPADVWAVGWNNETGGTIALHWDGKNWRRVATPNDPRSKNNQFEDVVAINRNDVWAVGFVYAALEGGNWALTEHWDGRHWRIVRTPARGYAHAQGVDGSSGRTVWAAGFEWPRTRRGVAPFAWHWQTNRWVVTRLPRSRYLSARLSDIAVTSRGSWAVGATDTAPDRGESGREGPYTVRQAPGRWRVVPAPAAAHPFRWKGVAKAGGGSVWAWTDSSLTHWNGRRWDITVRPPFSSGPDGEIDAADVARSPLWVVGHKLDADERPVVGTFTCG